MRYAIALPLLLMAGIVSGSEYVAIDLPTQATINKIFFANNQIGWAVTSDGEVLSTVDSGRNWRKMKVTSRNIRDIEVLGRQGYLTGDRGLLMKSSNGGATWNDMSLNIKYNFSGVGVVNDSVTIICGTDQNSMSKTKGQVFVTRDGGLSWKKHNRRLGHGFVDIATNPPRKVYLLAIRKVFHSISQGLRYFFGGYEGPRMAFGFDFMDDWGFMVGSKGYFAKSITHGKKWEEVDLQITNDLYAVEMFDKKSGVAVGDEGIIVFFYKDGEESSIDYYHKKTNLTTVCITGDRIYFGGEDGVMFYRRR